MSKLWAFKNSFKSSEYLQEPDWNIMNLEHQRMLYNMAVEYKTDLVFSGEGGDNILDSGNLWVLHDLLKDNEYTRFSKLMKMTSEKYQQPYWKIIIPNVILPHLKGSNYLKFDAKLHGRTWSNVGFYSKICIPDWTTEVFKNSIKYKSLAKSRECVYLHNEHNKKALDNSFSDLMLGNPCSWLNQHIQLPQKCYPYRSTELIEFLFSLKSVDKFKIGLNKDILRDPSLIPKKMLDSYDKSQTTFMVSKGVTNEWDNILELVENSFLIKIGWVDKQKLLISLKKVKSGFLDEFFLIVRFIVLEIWINNAAEHKYIK